MLQRYQSYLNSHPDFWEALKQNPAWLEELILKPECFGLLKVRYQDRKNQHLINKLQKMNMMLRLLESLNGE